jgi:transcriptional regulator with XRE-family HTH domain
VTGKPLQSWTTVIDGPRLRQLRHQHRLSQDELARRAGISLRTVARLERQPTATCRGRTLARLAGALGEQSAAMGLLMAVTEDSRLTSPAVKGSNED